VEVGLAVAASQASPVLEAVEAESCAEVGEFLCALAFPASATDEMAADVPEADSCDKGTPDCDADEDDVTFPGDSVVAEAWA